MEAYETIGENLDRPAWLELRRQGIGASDMPAILGLSRFDSPISIYESKINPAPVHQQEPNYTRIGREIEEIVLKMTAEDLHARYVHHPGTILRSTAYPWAMCTMDGELLWGGGIHDLEGTPVRREWCEIKTGAQKDEWKNGVPEDVYAQTQQQLLVTGAAKLNVGLFYTGFSADLGHATVSRDEDFLQDILIPSGEAFWKIVEERNLDALEVDGSEMTARALGMIFKTDPEKQAEALGEEWEAKADELEQLSQEAKILEDRKRQIKNELKKQIGDAGMLILSDGRYFRNIQIKETVVERKAHVQFRGPWGGQQ